MGGWVGGWRKMEEDEAVRMRYCMYGVWVGGGRRRRFECATVS